MSKERRSYIDEDGNALELDDAWFARARPMTDFPELLDLVKRQGRPPLPPSSASAASPCISTPTCSTG